MYYIFREQSDCSLKCVSKRKNWIKGQRTEALIIILKGWGKHSIFHVVRASSVKSAIYLIRNHQMPESIETDISFQDYGEYIESIIINEDFQ